MKSVELLKSNKITANSRLSLAYDSLRESLEALAIKLGYKIYNHECYACFLREVLKTAEEASEFDSLRRARNKANYYGNELSPSESDVLIERTKTLRVGILKYLTK